MRAAPVARSPETGSLFLEAADSRKPHVNSDTVTGILKRIIAENGRDHLWGYVFAICCLVVIALSTAFTAWIMRAIIDEAFANRRADVVWIICSRSSSLSCCAVLRATARRVALSKIGNNIVARYQRRIYSTPDDAVGRLLQRVPLGPYRGTGEPEC